MGDDRRGEEQVERRQEKKGKVDEEVLISRVDAMCGEVGNGEVVAQ